MLHHLTLEVNGSEHECEVDTRMSLLDLLRERAGLTGTKKGCNQGGCGACTVLVEGSRVLSCLTLAVQLEGRAVTTIEGLDHPLQDAFVEHDGFQCGYCTSGQLCSAVGMMAELDAGTPSHASPDVTAAAFEPTDSEIRERMSGNLCRCGAYNGIHDAIADVLSGRETTQATDDAALAGAQ